MYGGHLVKLVFSLSSIMMIKYPLGLLGGNSASFEELTNPL